MLPACVQRRGARLDSEKDLSLIAAAAAATKGDAGGLHERHSVVLGHQELQDAFNPITGIGRRVE